MDFQEQLLAAATERDLGYFTAKDIAALLDKTDASGLKEVYTALNALAEDGSLYVTEKGKYVLPAKLGYTRCKLRGNAKGFAFGLVPDGQDIFVPAKYMNGAFNDDIVYVKPLPATRGDSPEGEVVKIIARGNTECVGTYFKNKNFGFVTPDDKRFSSDIFVKKSANLNAKNGDKVVVNITRYPDPKDRDANPEGAITEIIGSAGDPWLDILSVMRQHNIKEDFPPAVTEEVLRVADEVSAADIAGRKDFRKLTTITIDGEDARDFDDAISISRRADGTYLLGVHIADVAQYVRPNTALDAEAQERGTSVYFPERAIPMLPKELCNGICSLNEGVDRLTLSVEMVVDGRGAVLDRTISEGVIRSRNRMTYTTVTKMLDGDEAEAERYPHLMPMVRDMADLCKILQEKRTRRGSIDFEMPESKITLDANGHVVDVAPYERTLSHRMIEEFMILANETVAEYMHHLELPFIYRVHEKPSEEKVESFRQFLNALGLSLKVTRGELHSRQLLDLLDSIKGQSVFPVVNRVMLRSMQKAKYSPDNVGHFGLSSKCYCHFTSPIRRYPDLMVHRIIKYLLHGELNQSMVKRLNAHLYDISAKSSEREKLADEAERDVDDLKKAEFMLDKIGNCYSGVVSGVTSFGVFVELENTVEGLIRIDNLPKDAYNYMENTYSLVGSKRTYRLGDGIRIRVDSVNMDSRRVEFIPEECESEHKNHSAQQKGGTRLLSGGQVRGGNRAGGKRNQVPAPRKSKPKGQLRSGS